MQMQWTMIRSFCCFRTNNCNQIESNNGHSTVSWVLNPFIRSSSFFMFRSGYIDYSWLMVWLCHQIVKLKTLVTCRDTSFRAKTEQVWQIWVLNLNLNLVIMFSFWLYCRYFSYIWHAFACFVYQILAFSLILTGVFAHVTVSYLILNAFGVPMI